MNTVDLALDPALKTVDFLEGPFAASPLVRPLQQLASELNTLVQTGQLQGIELDLKHAETPCFLLSIAPSAPKFYVELFVGEPFFDELFEKEDTEDKSSEDEAMPLNVLMNWMNSDTEPTFWQTCFHHQGATSTNNASSDVDFTELINHILLLTKGLPQTKA